MNQNIQTLVDQLNDQQREAVMINGGSLLVFAGAGSGKTRVITTKIAYAIEELGINPWQILAVTFTNRACNEMQERVVSMVGEEKGKNVMIRTFHSFGVWMLRKHGSKVGLDPNFKIYDDDDSAALLQQCYPDANKKDLVQYAKKIGTLKDKMQRPNKLDQRLNEYYYKYEEKLRATGNVDFADMIIKTIQLLQQNPDVKEWVHNRFKVILVDEYQDSNNAQFLLLKEIVGPNTFVCAVGDDDQSIYRFRGAEVKNILEFPNAFPGTKKVVLGKNYRCTESILNAASDVIVHNKTRAMKDLNANKRGGELPTLFYVDSGYDEAQQVVNILKKSVLKDPEAYNKSAVLYRTNAQSKDFEDRFMMNNIPYHLVGSLRFYDREEIKDSIELISFIVNPRDTVAFQRMVNKPSRGVGETSIENILNYAAQHPTLSGSIVESAKDAISMGAIKGVAVKGLQSFITAFDSCSQAFGTMDNGEFLKKILMDFGLLEYYTRRDADEKDREGKRTDNLNQLVNMLSAPQFCEGQEGINYFLEFASLDPSGLGQDGKPQGGVTLITMHNTKGLEYDRVFCVGMEDEIFPGRRDDQTQDDLEEERRICYVAMTRAKNELYMFTASSRLKWGSVQMQSPSMFLKEIEDDHIQVKDLRQDRRFGKYRFGGDDDLFGGNSYGNRGGYGGYNSGYNSGYGNGYSYKDKNRYSSNYINTEKRSSFDDDDRVGKPKPSPVSKYNIRNQSSPTAKPQVKLVKKESLEKANAKDFAVGDRIRSPFFGDGTVTGKKSFAGRETIEVKFDSGRTGTFAVNNVQFEKIG